MDLKKVVREINDFPIPGISFKDITTLLQDGKAFKYSIDAIIEDLKDKNVGLTRRQQGIISDIMLEFNMATPEG